MKQNANNGKGIAGYLLCGAVLLSNQESGHLPNKN
jgi:hypothetical protein